MRSPEQDDAVNRARKEVDLFLSKYARRMKTRAVEIALDLMAKEEGMDPDDAGRQAAREAGKQLKLLTRAAQTALETQDH